jgi:hypothetical protein
MVGQKDRKKKKKDTERKKLEKRCSDFSELSVMLAKYGLHIFPVEGDGNCLFRSFAQVYAGSEHKHAEYRLACCDYMEEHVDDFKAFVDDSVEFSDYVATMRQDAEWGTQLELTALCRCFNVSAVVFQVDGVHYEIHLQEDDSTPTFLITYHDQEHFNAVAWSRGEDLQLLAEVRRRLGGAGESAKLSKRELKALKKTGENLQDVKELFVKT